MVSQTTGRTDGSHGVTSQSRNCATVGLSNRDDIAVEKVWNRRLGCSLTGEGACATLTCGRSETVGESKSGFFNSPPVTALTQARVLGPIRVTSIGWKPRFKAGDSGFRR